MNKCGYLMAGLLALHVVATGTYGQDVVPKVPTAEYLFYRWEGGFSPYSWIEVSIHNDGQSKVSYERKSDKTVSTNLKLSPSEMQALKTRIRAAGEVDLPAKSSIPVGDGGRTTLRVARDDGVVQWSFAHHVPLGLTTEFLGRVWNQAVILRDLETKDDAYAALYASPKILQPFALQAPLQSLVRRSNDMQKLSYALRALSNLMAPDELMGTFATELETAAPERKITLLHSLCFGGQQLSPAHRRALISLLSLELRSAYKTLSEQPDYSQQVYKDIVRFLGTQRDEQAVSVLILIAEAPTADQTLLSLTRNSLAETGYSAIGPLSALLDHKSPTVRYFAADTFCQMVTISPHGRSTDERQQAISYLKQLVPRFESQAKSDADADVRRAAAKAIELIQAE